MSPLKTQTVIHIHKYDDISERRLCIQNEFKQLDELKIHCLECNEECFWDYDIFKVTLLGQKKVV